MNNRCSVIIPAAGIGARMGESIPKQYIRIMDKPILCYAIEAFEKNENISQIIPVVGTLDLELVSDLISRYSYKKIGKIAIGGKLRQDSVLSGLSLVNDNTDIVMIHDGARPFISQEDITNIYKGVIEYNACVLAVRAKDTIKISDSNGFVLKTPDRKELWNVQTPQGFKIDILRLAYERATKDGFIGTDDSSLVERLGIKVKLIEGNYTNKKITTTDDLYGAERLIREVL